MRCGSFRAGTFVALVACNGGEGSEVGSGPDPDARLISDINTWGCGLTESERFMGVLSQDVSFEVAPDALESRSLPAPGACETGLDLFPNDAGEGGQDVEDIVGDPTWKGQQSNGFLRRRSPGFWSELDGGTTLSCTGATDVGSVALYDAGPFDAVAAPPAPTDGMVEFGDEVDDGIELGEQVEVAIEAPGWSSVWVQLRRERQGEAWETVTCNITGDSQFILDEGHWSAIDENLSAEMNELIVVFQISESVEVADGLEVEAITRSVSRASDL